MFYLNVIEYFTLALFLGLLTLAAISDLRFYRIPNRISLLILTLYPAHIVTYSGTIDWQVSLLLALVTFLSGFLLFSLQLMGGGDVKLLSATALWAGPELIFEFLALTGIAGGLMALFMLSPLRFALAMTFDNHKNTEATKASLGGALPYGVAISIGGYAVGAALLNG